MRKAVSMAIPALVLVVLGVVLNAWESRRPPDWQVELEQYLASRPLPSGAIEVRAVAEASRPWAFRREMGRPVDSEWPWRAISPPFPPSQVTCVLLGRDRYAADDDRREQVYEVVFLTYHTDHLWNHGWVVHEGRDEPFSPAFKGLMSAIGCDLELERYLPVRASAFTGVRLGALSTPASEVWLGVERTWKSTSLDRERPPAEQKTWIVPSE